MIADRLAAQVKVSWLVCRHVVLTSYWLMPNLLHPSRFVVLRRSSIWKKSMGEVELCNGPSIALRALSRDHGFGILGVVMTDGSISELWVL
jgi:hypothetical protein